MRQNPDATSLIIPYARTRDVIIRGVIILSAFYEKKKMLK